jgi:hypothetical protein
MQLDMTDRLITQTDGKSLEMAPDFHISADDTLNISLSEAFRLARALTLPAVEDGSATPLQMIVAGLATHLD